MSAREASTSSLGTAIEASIWGLVVCGMSGGYVVTWFPYLLLGLAGSAQRMVRDSAAKS